MEDSKFKSVRDAVWEVNDVSESDLFLMRQKCDSSDILSRILIARGVTPEHALDFLNPSLRNSMPNPMKLLDMEKAVERIIVAIKKKEKIAIFGDYDVDGASSSAMLKRYFNSLAVESVIYIPDRLEEGYGPNIGALDYLQNKEKASLCITVDCGTVSCEPLEYAMGNGLDVIVVDHHLSTERLPNVVAVVNPNRLDESMYECRDLAAAGVVFMLLAALNKRLRDIGFFSSDVQEPNLLNFLDLAAFATVCDVMKLVGLNRIFVSQGLKVISKNKSVGFRALIDVTGIRSEITTHHLGFILGPRINAGGRVGESESRESCLGSILLSTDDPEEAAKCAIRLDHLNDVRRDLESRALSEALEQVNKQLKEGRQFIMVVGNWHPGVIGVIAGRIKETFKKPTAVVSSHDGIFKASARSVPGIDFGSAVLEAKANGVIIEGGGHSMAVGFSFLEEKMEAVREFFNKKFAHIVSKSKEVLKADGVISFFALKRSLFDVINKAAPFGTGNLEPQFIITDVVITSFVVVNDEHVNCMISSSNGKAKNMIKAVAFRSVGTRVGYVMMQKRKSISIFGKIKTNFWNGRNEVQVIIDDIAVDD